MFSKGIDDHKNERPYLYPKSKTNLETISTKQSINAIVSNSSVATAVSLDDLKRDIPLVKRYFNYTVWSISNLSTYV